MEDLRNSIRDARGDITAWAAQDSRFSGVRPADDHFSAGRGAHLEGYIQEWLIIRAEQSRESAIGTVLGATLQSAVLQAVHMAERASRTVEPSLRGSLIGGFVQAANLVTGTGWQGAPSGHNRADTQDQPLISAPESGTGRQGSADVDSQGATCQGSTPQHRENDQSGPSSQRRRLDEAGSYSHGRMYCPVPGCPESDPARAAGWTCWTSLRNHLAEHVAGRFAGDIPQDFLSEHRLTICTVCSRLLSTRFGSACPSCRPTLQRSRDQPSSGRSIPEDYPSLSEVFLTNVSCKAYVPKAAKHLWAQALLASIAAVLRHNDELAWLELLMLPKCVLRTSGRGGKKHRAQIDAETKRLCKDWVEGQRAQLWRQSRSLLSRNRRRRSQAKSMDQSGRNERAIQLTKEELLSKACAALVNGPPAIVTEAIKVEMRNKHPAAREEDTGRTAGLREVHPAAARLLSTDEVKKSVRKFPKGSGGGPSGLRPQHLKDALVGGLEDEVVKNFADLVNLLVRAEAPSAIAPWLCGASLAALPKPQGGHRPVAVGEAWRRLAAKALSSSVVDDLKAHLEPVQLGVGTRLACEAIVHVVRQWCVRNSNNADRCLVKMDLSNAFNCVDRSAVLTAVRRVAPQLAPWVDFCYRASSNLVLGQELLKSERGVQQGDPLGPALFALGIHETVLKVKAEVDRRHADELDFSVFYLDDGVVAGSSRAASLFCTRLREELAGIGLELAFDKCEIVPAARDQHRIPASSFPGFLWIQQGDFKLLEAPIGSEAFCTEHVNHRIEKAESLLRRIAELGNSQCSYVLLKQCAGFAKLTYSIRTVPPELHRQALQSFSAHLQKALADIVAELAIEDRTWELAQLSIQKGGVGLRTAERHASAAYLASVRSCQECCQSVDAAFDPSDSCGALGVESALAEFNEQILEPARGPLQEDHSSQKRLSALVEAASKVRLLASPAADLSFKAHVSLCTLATAGAWLTTLPSDEARAVDHPLFQIALKRRLRMKLFAEDTFCLSCGACMDSFGDHALVCPCKGNRTIRHNCMRNEVHDEARLAGLRPEREKAGLLPQRPERDGLATSVDSRRRRPADVWLPRGPRNQGIALDFACTSGLGLGLLEQSASQAPAIFADYEHFKRSFKDTSQICQAQGFGFEPVVFEAHSGAWSPAARKLFDFITQKAASTSSSYTPPEVQSLRFAQRLSITLQRENARAIAQRTAELPEAARSSDWDLWED